MSKRLLFTLFTFISLSIFGQIDVRPDYTKPYFQGNVKVQDTLGTDNLLSKNGRFVLVDSISVKSDLVPFELSKVLGAGNTTADGQTISAENGNAFLDLRSQNSDNLVRLQGGEDFISLGNSSVAMFGGDFTSDIAFGNLNINPGIASLSLIKSDFSRFGQISVLENSNSDQSSGFFPNYPTVLSSQSYTVNQNIFNSITLGGEGITMKTPNSAYANTFIINKPFEDFETKISTISPTAERTVNFPDNSGTVALTSDISNVYENNGIVGSNREVTLTDNLTFDKGTLTVKGPGSGDSFYNPFSVSSDFENVNGGFGFDFTTSGLGVTRRVLRTNGVAWSLSNEFFFGDRRSSIDMISSPNQNAIRIYSASSVNDVRFYISEKSSFWNPVNNAFNLGLGMGENEATAKVSVKGGSFSSSNKSFDVRNSLDSYSFAILNDGNIGVGTDSPNSSNILDIISTTKAFSPPKMTTAQMNLITTANVGSVVTDIDEGKNAEFDGVAWHYFRQTANGSFYITNPVQTNIGAINTPIKFAGTTSTVSLDKFDDNGGVSNRLRYIGDDSRAFTVVASISATSSQNNRIFSFYVYKFDASLGTGAIVPSSQMQTKIANGSDVVSFPLNCTVDLEPNDYIEIWVAGNTNGSANPTGNFMNVSIK